MPRVSISDLVKINFDPPSPPPPPPPPGDNSPPPQPDEQEDEWPPKMPPKSPPKSSEDDKTKGEEPEGEGPEGDSSEGEEPEEEGPGGEGEGEGDEDGDEGGSGEGDEEDEGDDGDDILNDIEQRLAKRKEYDPEDPGQVQSTAKQGDQTQKGTGGYGDVEKVKPPAFSWQALLRQFVSTASRAEPTYAKINRRAATAASGVRVMGRGAIKPGERTETLGFKMFAAFDTSGSMAGVFPSTMALIEKFIKEKEGDIQGIFGVGILGFTVPELYAANLKARKAWKIDSFAEIEQKPPAVTFPVEGLFTRGSYGGDELPDAALSALDAALSSGYNVLLMTDSHIVDKKGNLVNLKKLVAKHRRGLFIILDSSASYQAVIKQVGQHNFITHL